MERMHMIFFAPGLFTRVGVLYAQKAGPRLCRRLLLAACGRTRCWRCRRRRKRARQPSSAAFAGGGPAAGAVALRQRGGPLRQHGDAHGRDPRQSGASGAVFVWAKRVQSIAALRLAAGHEARSAASTRRFIIRCFGVTARPAAAAAAVTTTAERETGHCCARRRTWWTG